MTTRQEYAALSAFIYNNERGNRSETNTLQAPPGWTQLRAANGFPAQTSYDDNFFSFTAGAFVNKSTGEVVISYKGTDFLVEFSGRAWNTVGDILTDLSAGVGGFVSTAQFVQAATYYQDVKRWAQANGYDASRISFTGHSLGGGIASVMATWFNRSATTFAEAPFEPTVSSPITLNAVAAALALRGNSDADFSAFYQGWLNPNGNAVFESRQSLVTNYYMQGEFLEYLRTTPTAIYGTTNAIAIGAQPASRALALHSMNLHLALVIDDRLRQACIAIPELIPALIDTSLYAADPNSGTRDFVTALVADQMQGTLTRTNGLLGRFTGDVLKLNQSQGTVAAPAFRKALIVAAMDYYLNAPSAATGLFTSSGGAINFSYADIPGDKTKSLPLLMDATSKLDDKSAHFIRSYAADSQSWHIQSGTAALNWTASNADDSAAIGGTGTDVETGGAGNDLLMGLDGADTLKGSEGADLLVGGDGADELDGGTGSDYLYGGAGSDTYAFSGNFGNDWLTDSDGQGSIKVDDQDLPSSAAKKVADNIYRDKATGWSFTKVNVQTDGSADLVIQKDGSPNNSITIRHWTNGQLGINLSDTKEDAPKGIALFKGDFKKKVSGTTYQFDAYGNYANDGAAANEPDVIRGTTGADSIDGQGGNDGLFGGNGNDVINGGDGADLLLGGQGADTINGDAGRDYIFGSASGDINTFTSTSDALQPASIPLQDRGFSWAIYAPADWSYYNPNKTAGLVTIAQDAPSVINGGAGNDLIRAGSGNDFVDGGADNDNIMGLGGNDNLLGNLGDDTISGDGMALNRTPVEGVAPEDHGADVLDGGTGNDKLSGQGGKDSLYGGDDSDSLWGDDTDADATPLAIHDNDYLDGGAGNDQLIGGGKDDELFGGAGNDALWGDDAQEKVDITAHGNDYLDGEDGDDQLIGGGKDDELFGGSGKDILLGDDTQDQVAVSAHGKDYLDGEAGDDQLTGGGDDDELFGGDDNDSLWGDDTQDKVAASAHGNDYLDGEDGNDQLTGGGKDDQLIGGKGNDKLWGDDSQKNLATSAHGFDYLDGGDGDDVLVGGGKDDTLLGGQGKDSLWGDDDLAADLPASAHGNDYLDGGTEDDQLIGGGQSDTLYGGQGNDNLWGDGVQSKVATSAHGNDILNGGEGLDRLIGGGKDDQLYGGADNDTLIGDDTDSNVPMAAHGNDYLDGGDGNDQLQGSGGNDTLVGGEGNDWLTGEDQLSTSASSAMTGNDNLYGDSGADTLLGGNGDDFLDGGTDNDTLLGGAGNDTLNGGSANDLLNGGAGLDTYIFGRGSGQDTINSTDLEADLIELGADIVKADVTQTRSGNHLLLSINGTNDQLTVQNYFVKGLDTIQFSNGTTLSAAAVEAKVMRSTANADNLSGYDFADTISGGEGDDTLSGLGGEDRLSGGAGADSLLGGYGNDLITGGTGNDVINGGVGNNTYVFGRGDGQDTIQSYFDTNAAKLNVLLFKSNITPEDVIVRIQSNGDLAFALKDRDDKITVQGFLNGPSYNPLQEVHFDGSDDVWNIKKITDKALTALNDSLNAADTLYGTSGDDAISGPQSYSYIYGGAGNDTITGGTKVFGGAGNDTYVMLRDQSVTITIGAEQSNNRDKVIIPYAFANATFAREYALDTHSFPDSLSIRLARSTNKNEDRFLTINDFFTYQGPENTIQELQFLDRTLTRADVLSMSLLLTQDGDKNRIYGYHWANTIDAQGGSDYVQTYEGADSIKGGEGNDSVNAGQGTDVIDGGNGNDELYGGVGNDVLAGGDGDDKLYGDEGDDVITGGNGNDLLAGLSGRDTLTGGAGDDVLRGYDGNDTYKFGWGQGNDTIWDTSGQISEVDTITLDEGVKETDVTLIRDGDDLFLTLGTAANRPELLIDNYYAEHAGKYDEKIEIIHFFSGVDWKVNDIASRVTYGIADTVSGSSGNDVFTVDHHGDVIIEAATGGADAVYSSVSYTLPDNIENLTLTGVASASLWGNALNNRLTGNAGNNRIWGGGFDTLIGGGGNDIYYVNLHANAALTDQIVELADGGTDSLITTSYNAVLPDNIENLTWIEDSDRGNSYSTALRTLKGNASNNVIRASRSWNDPPTRIDGGAGADTMYGYGYNTIYVVDDPGDVIEPGDGPMDWGKVESSISYTLGGKLSSLALTGDNPITGRGDNEGNTLDGRRSSGANLLVGGNGNDTYYLGAGDTVQENAEEGIDTIEIGAVGNNDILSVGYNYRSPLNTYTLPDNIENLIGDKFDNNLTGNAENNLLSGLDGHDTLSGMDGDDSLDGAAGQDWLYGGAGQDTLSGGTGVNYLYGGTGNDLYQVVGGNDSLYRNYIVEWDSTANTMDVVSIDAQYDQLTAAGKDGNDLIIQFTYSSTPAITNKVIVQDFFLNPAWSIEQVRFRDRVLDNATLQALATAPAMVTGTAGSDMLAGTASFDRLNGLSGNDSLYGGDGMDSLYGGADNDSLDGGAADDLLTGDAGSDILQGGSGQDKLQGGNDNDLLNGGADNDSLMGDAGNDTLQGDSGQDKLQGGDDNDQLYGGADNDSLMGDAGNDTLDGGSGADTLDGGAGDDVYYIDNANDLIQDFAGTSTVYVSTTTRFSGKGDLIYLVANGGTAEFRATGYASSVIGNELNNILIGGRSMDGGVGNDSLVGYSGDDSLIGGAGNDTMAGDSGNDTYYVQDAGDVVVEVASYGRDTVYIQGLPSYTLTRYVEVGVLTSTSPTGGTLIGNESANSLTGYNFNDTLDGGESADTMTGGLGNDSYVVDNAGDIIIESTGQGTDTASSSASYTLGAEVENLTLTGDDSLIGTGNILANFMTGNLSDNVLNGERGNDTLLGGLGDDTLNGGEGDDILNGEVGEDSMVGGLGNDTYYVDNLDDVVTEADNQGVDTVNSSISWTLSNTIEHLVLTGTTNIDGNGNALDNNLAGNAGNNHLAGMNGADTLAGDAGNDTLFGGEGNDKLDGGSGADTLLGGLGADTMLGGLGDDTYYVDNQGDTEIESTNGGRDTVYTSVNFSTPSNVERVLATGNGSITLSSDGLSTNTLLAGNAAGNLIIGGSGNDSLFGAAGIDALSGGAGNDTLRGGSRNDYLSGDAGDDTYIVGAYDGMDVISDDNVSGHDTLLLEGVSESGVWLALDSEGTLTVSIMSTSSGARISSWAVGQDHVIDEIKAGATGKVLSGSKIDSLVQFMASMTPPTPGQTSFAQPIQDKLNHAIAASWA